MLQRAEQHKLEAEARRRVDEVRELQKVCSASLSQMDCTCSSAVPVVLHWRHKDMLGLQPDHFACCPCCRRSSRLLAVPQALRTDRSLLLHSRRARI